MAADIHYQMYETYYKRAVEAESNEQWVDAKQLYLCSSRSLLKAAKQVNGEMKLALIQRAEKVQRIADLIEVPESRTDSELDVSNKTGGDEKQDGNIIWKSAGKTNIRFSDIAGLQEVKESILHRIVLPRKHPEIYEIFKRKVNGGILLYGPPGTGKTMVAKAIACEVDAVFYSVRCSDIVGKYFGESEKKIKSLFETARKDESAVIFFDEFEALAAQRGGDSSVMNRLVPELLSQMDGFQTEEKNNIMFLAATNRPWDIDSAFLRPPRLTEKIYVGLPDEAARLFLIKRAFEEVPMESSVDMNLMVDYTDGFNAADVVSFCEVIKDFAIDRSIINQSASAIMVQDVMNAKKKVQSSVQKSDLELLSKWRKEQYK